MSALPTPLSAATAAVAGAGRLLVYGADSAGSQAVQMLPLGTQVYTHNTTSTTPKHHTQAKNARKLLCAHAHTCK